MSKKPRYGGDRVFRGARKLGGFGAGLHGGRFFEAIFFFVHADPFKFKMLIDPTYDAFQCGRYILIFVEQVSMLDQDWYDDDAEEGGKITFEE